METVKGYAVHEKGIFENTAEARTKYFQAKGTKEQVEAAEGLERALSRLLLLREAYPELKANENFLKLQDSLEGTENRISVERKRYNDSVRTQMMDLAKGECGSGTELRIAPFAHEKGSLWQKYAGQRLTAVWIGNLAQRLATGDTQLILFARIQQRHQFCFSSTGSQLTDTSYGTHRKISHMVFGKLQQQVGNRLVIQALGKAVGCFANIGVLVAHRKENLVTHIRGYGIDDIQNSPALLSADFQNQ